MSSAAFWRASFHLQLALGFLQSDVVGELVQPLGLLGLCGEMRLVILLALLEHGGRRREGRGEPMKLV
jgi:hypothetical protein